MHGWPCERQTRQTAAIRHQLQFMSPSRDKRLPGIYVKIFCNSILLGQSYSAVLIGREYQKADTEMPVQNCPHSTALPRLDFSKLCRSCALHHHLYRAPPPTHRVSSLHRSRSLSLYQFRFRQSICSTKHSATCPHKAAPSTSLLQCTPRIISIYLNCS